MVVLRTPYEALRDNPWFASILSAALGVIDHPMAAMGGVWRHRCERRIQPKGNLGRLHYRSDGDLPVARAIFGQRNGGRSNLALNDERGDRSFQSCRGTGRRRPGAGW